MERLIPIRLGMVSVFAVVGGQGTVLIDTGMAGQGQALLDGLTGAGIEPGDIRLIVITHGHVDHFGNARFLRERSKAPVPILVHSLDADKVRNGDLEFPGSFNFLGTVFSAVFRAFQRVSSFLGAEGFDCRLEPDIVIDGEFDLSPFGVRGRVIHTPGHTRGSVSVILETGDAVIGDMLGNPLKPSRPALPLWGSDLPLLKKSVRKVMGFRPKLIHPSHVKPFTLEALERKWPTSRR